MSTITQNTDQTDRHKSRLVTASLFLVIGLLMPTINPTQSNMTWFWESLIYPSGHPNTLSLMIIVSSFLIAFIPLLLSLTLATRMAAINILLAMLLLGAMQALPFHTQAILLGIMPSSSSSYVSTLANISLYSLVILGAGSRLALALPNHQYPLLMIRMSSILLLYIIGIIIYSKLLPHINATSLTNTLIHSRYFGIPKGELTAIDFLPEAWLKSPIHLIYLMSFPLFILYSIFSSFKKVSPKNINTIILVLLTLAGILFLQTSLYTYNKTNFLNLLALIKFSLLAFAYIGLLSYGLYSSCYLFTKNKESPAKM